MQNADDYTVFMQRLYSHLFTDRLFPDSNLTATERAAPVGNYRTAPPLPDPGVGVVEADPGGTNRARDSATIRTVARIASVEEPYNP